MAGWETVSYSRNDMMHMQQDAERRVREMQRKAQQAISRGIVPPPPKAQPNNVKETKTDTPPQAKEELHRKSAVENHGQNTQNAQNIRNNQNTQNMQNAQNMHNNQNTQNPTMNFKNQQQNFGPQAQRQTSPIQSLTSPIKNIGNMIGGLLGKDSGGVQNILSGFIKENQEDTPVGKVMSALNLDSEKLILIFLILVLLNDGADYSLILALGYILL